MTLTDNSYMPFGAHKGSKMGDIPADYLIFLWDKRKCYGDVKEYIRENLPTLREQVKAADLRKAK